jgi:hypothetical protein
MTHKFDAAVTAIRRHMFEMTSHRASMNEHMLAAGAQLLALRARIEAGECGDVDWWEWFDANVRHSRKDAEKLMRIAQADLTELGS